MKIKTFSFDTWPTHSQPLAIQTKLNTNCYSKTGEYNGSWISPWKWFVSFRAERQSQKSILKPNWHGNIENSNMASEYHSAARCVSDPYATFYTRQFYWVEAHITFKSVEMKKTFNQSNRIVHKDCNSDSIEHYLVITLPSSCAIHSKHFTQSCVFWISKLKLFRVWHNWQDSKKISISSKRKRRSSH